MPHPDNPQMTERTMWAVVYRDGSMFLEYPDPTTHNSFTLVDLQNVVRLELTPNPWLGEEGPTFVVPIYEGMRPIFFRQNAITVMPDHQEHMRYTVIGYQTAALDREGRNVQHLTYIPETHIDRPIVLSPDRLEIG